MAIAVDAKTPIRVILPSDVDKAESDQTVFYVRPLTLRFMKKLAKQVKTNGQAEFDFDAVLDLLSDLVIRWENFKTFDGTVVPSTTSTDGKISAACWEFFSPGTLLELVKTIMESNAIGDVEIKN